ncbi:MAG: hypothetical protein ACFFFC_13700 [Candidatus Thorarchaeota archaeon]
MKVVAWENVSTSNHSFRDTPSAYLRMSTVLCFRKPSREYKAETHQFHVLSEWQDIDTMRNLREFYKKHQANSLNTLIAMKYLRSHKGILQMASSKPVENQL